MGAERAETYLMRLAEAELRRAGAELRRLDIAAGGKDIDLRADPGMSPFQASELATWNVLRPGRILVAAGVLGQAYLDRLVSDHAAAVEVRSRLLLNWHRDVLHRTLFEPVSRPAPDPVQPMRVAPVGATLRVAGDRTPWTLHLLSLVRTPGQAVITVALRGTGPQHYMLYDQLEAVDEQGTRYTVRVESSVGEPAAWFGVARLTPVPPPGVRWLDLISEGTRPLRLAIGPQAPPGHQAAPPATERVAFTPAERLLVLEAERILASGDVRGPREGPVPGEIVTVLTQTGAIAPGSPVPGQLAALCQRLGAADHGITVPAAAELPAPWASVLACREEPAADAFAPLACLFPELDGARFALAGLSTAAGRSHLHVISSGMPRLARRYQWDWKPGFSWWLRDGAGHWHVATPGEPRALDDGLLAFRLRLTPPLATFPATVEVEVTGPATRARVTVPVT